MSGFTYGNGIVHAMTQNARQLPARSLDSHGSGGNTTKVLDDTYTYDANGNVLSMADASNAPATDNRTWGKVVGAPTLYDGLDRLISVRSTNQWGTAPSGSYNAVYSYDPLDNLRTSQLGASTLTRGYDANNRLASLFNGMTTWTIGSDARGNVTSNTMRSQAYEFDLSHRINAVTGKESYLYDGNGRRARTLNLQTGTIEYFGYGADGRLLADWSNRRQVRNQYIYLGNTLVGLNEVSITTFAVAPRYKHTDALGSPVVTTDAARNVLSRMSYTPYGAPMTPMDGVGYTGHFIDVGTGLTYMQQRYYDPAIGRFLSIDPMPSDARTSWNFNRYYYAENNPFRYIDPDGRQSSAACATPQGAPACAAAGMVGDGAGAGTAAGGGASNSAGNGILAAVLAAIGIDMSESEEAAPAEPATEAVNETTDKIRGDKQPVPGAAGERGELRGDPEVVKEDWETVNQTPGAKVKDDRNVELPDGSNANRHPSGRPYKDGPPQGTDTIKIYPPGSNIPSTVIRYY